MTRNSYSRSPLGERELKRCPRCRSQETGGRSPLGERELKQPWGAQA